MVQDFTRHFTDLVSHPQDLTAAVASTLARFSLRSCVILLGIAVGGYPLGGSANIPSTPGMQDTNSRSGGSRGCSLLLEQSHGSDFSSLVNLSQSNSGETTPALVLLTDAQRRVQTRSTHPSFAWFVRDSAPVPLEFRIYRQPNAEEIASGDRHPEDAVLLAELSNDRFVSRPGIMTLTLPPSVAPLIPGQQYWWQVEMLCDPSDPSSNNFAEAHLEIAPENAEPLWYDQLDAMLKTEANSKKANPEQGHELCEDVSKELAELLRLEMEISPQTVLELQNSEFFPISTRLWSEF